MSKETLFNRLYSKVSINDNLCWEFIGSTVHNGYGQIYVEEGLPCQLAHRVSFELAKSSIPEDLYVLHTCDNRLCINPAHLFLGTHQDNMDDMVSKKRHAHGEKASNVKLTEKEVLEIRAKYIPYQYTTSILATEYGVSVGCIKRIVNKSVRTWKHIK